jgi:TM2 domain-containing membrane protein YozV
MQQQNSHSIVLGYIMWVFGFMGAHRFYYGRPITGTIWLFTCGLFFIGWIIDLFLIPKMDAEADHEFKTGPIDYNVTWLLLVLLGWLGVHRMYMGKWLTAILYLCTLGVLGLGIIYDFWTLNRQIDDINSESPEPRYSLN